MEQTKNSDDLHLFKETGFFEERDLALRHLKDADEILYILEGDGELTLDGKKIQVSAGSAVFIPRNAPHSFISGAQGLKALQVYAPGGPEQRFLKAPTKTSE